MSTSKAFAGVDPIMRRTIDQRGEVAEELTRRASWRSAKELIAEEAQRRDVETKTTIVNEQLQRTMSQKMASRMLDEEKQRRVVLAMASDVLAELERRANAAEADRAMTEEFERRVAQESALQQQENSERTANQIRANEDMDNEKKRRESVGLPTQEAAFGQLSWFANEVVRAINKSAALLGEDEERRRRMMEDLRSQVAGDLQRKLNARKADRGSEAERVRRIASDKKIEVMCELTSRADRKLASELSEAERRRLVAANEDFPYGRTSENKSQILEKIHSRQSLLTALKAEEDARKEYALADIYHKVAEEVCFRVNKAAALVAQENERSERVARAKFIGNVVPEIEARGRFKSILEQVRAAQEDLTKAMPESLRLRAEDPNVGSLLEDIIRHGNQQEARRLADEEKTRRTAENRKLDVLDDLQRVIAQKNVSSEVSLESARANHMRKFELAREQAAAEARWKDLSCFIAREQSEEKTDAPHSPTLKEILEYVRSDVERLGARREVAQAVKEEQERRTQAARGEDVFPGVIRAVNQREATRACILEQHQRVARLKGEDVLSELSRRALQNAVRAQTETERSYREAGMKDELLRRSNSANFREVLDEIQRESLRNEVLRQMDLEQSERVNRDRLGWVISDLERHLNRLRAANDAEMERCRRVGANKTHAVLDELVRYHNRMIADGLVCNEQARRVRDMDVERNRRASFLQFYDILEQVERKYAQQVAIRDAELERDARMTQETFAKVLTQLIRTAAQKDADFAMDAERVLRMAQEAFEAVNVEFKRRVNAQAADKAADQERLDRIRRLSEDASVLVNVMASPIPMVHEQLRRKASWKQSKAAYEEEQTQAEVRERGVSVREELLRIAAVKEVEAAIELERQRLLHIERTRAVHEEMARARSVKLIHAAIEQERKERIATAATTAMKFALTAANYQRDIPCAAATLRRQREERQLIYEEQNQQQVSSPVSRAKVSSLERLLTQSENNAVPIVEEQHRRMMKDLDQGSDEHIARLMNRHLASMLSDEEKSRRVSEMLEEDSAAEFERHRAQLEAAFEISVEKHARTQAVAESSENLDEERRIRQEWAKYVSDEERRRRIYEADLGFTNTRPRPGHLVALLSADCDLFDFTLVDGSDTNELDQDWSELSNNLCVSPREIRLENDLTSSMRSALEFYQEQQRRRIEDKECELAIDLERSFNKRRAQHEQDLERFSRVEHAKLQESISSLERMHAVNSAKRMADLERDRRMLERTYVEKMTADTKRVNQQKAIRDMEEERTRRINESTEFQEALQRAIRAELESSK